MGEDQAWWHKGIQFECQGSGRCCVSHGEYGFVYMTKQDRIRMARHFGMTSGTFTKNHCKKDDGVYHLIDGPKGHCQFLKDRKCQVYEARPTQCRTWPFWPEVMDAKTWNTEVASFCPGVGKGRTWSREDIEAQLEIQKDAEAQD